MSYYWTYYLFTFFLAFAQKNPLFALVAVVFFLLRPWLPDPVRLFRYYGRVGALKRQAQVNPANIVARRDLGIAYLELLRPRAALRFLDEAQTRAPRDQEIAYLRGTALLKIGDAEGAIRAFGTAVGIDADAGEPFSSVSGHGHDRAFRRYGEAFLGAATALERVGRYAQAEEALTLAASSNSSSIEPLVRLAHVRRAQGDEPGARAARDEARRTYAQLPGFLKRKQIGWYARSILA